MPENYVKKDPLLADHNEAILILLITIVLTFFLGIFVLFIGLNRAHMVFAEILIVIPAYIFVNKKSYSIKRTFRLGRLHSNILFPSIIIGLSLSVISDELDRLIDLVFPMPDFFRTAIVESLTINSTSDFIIIISSSIFFAVICEELLFRGFIQTSFENSFDITKAIMLTSLTFAIIHLNPWWTIQLLFFSIFLGVIAWKSNNIIPSMIAHFINNALGILFVNLEESSFSWYLFRNHVNPFIVIAAIIGLYFGINEFYRICDENKKLISSERTDT